MTKTSDSRTGQAATIALAAIVAIGLFALSWLYVKQRFPEPTTAAEFGDQFGAVNALFSGLAFAGVILALVFQSRELKAQREELSLTRSEMHTQGLHLEQQASALKRQATALKHQSFEGTFFELVRLHAAGVASLDVGTRIEETGTDCFPRWLDELRTAYASKSREVTPPRSALEQAYQSFYDEKCQDLGRYFRSLKNILLFLDQAEVENKEPYERAVRSQLTDYEMILVFYHCETYARTGDFRDLVKKHSTIRGLNRRLLLDHDHQQFELSI